MNKEDALKDLERLKKQLSEGKNPEVKIAYDKVQDFQKALMGDGKKTMAMFAVSSALNDTIVMAKEAGKRVGAHDIFQILIACLVRLEQEDIIKINLKKDGKATKQDK